MRKPTPQALSPLMLQAPRNGSYASRLETRDDVPAELEERGRPYGHWSFCYTRSPAVTGREPSRLFFLCLPFPLSLPLSFPRPSPSRLIPCPPSFHAPFPWCEWCLAPRALPGTHPGGASIPPLIYNVG